MGYDIYETTFELASNVTKIPSVSAFADNPEVKVTVTQAESISGTTIVKFDYNSVVKTYKVVFAQTKMAGDIHTE